MKKYPIYEGDLIIGELIISDNKLSGYSLSAKINIKKYKFYD